LIYEIIDETFLSAVIFPAVRSMTFGALERLLKHPKLYMRIVLFYILMAGKAILSG